MKYFKIITCALSLSFLLMMSSCESETKTLDIGSLGEEYFPISVGDYKIFRVDSIVISNFAMEARESTFFIKEEVTEQFLNSAGDSVYRIERSRSDDRFGNYVVTDVWTSELTSSAAMRTEENLTFNKLIFPFTLNTKWNGLLFDDQVEVLVAGTKVKVYKDWGDHEVIADGIDLNVNGKTYNDVVTVQQADHDFILERRYSLEHYAPNLGLIRKEMQIFDTQCECPNDTWLEKADAGFMMSQVLVEHN